ncbi:MAG: histidinol-phosphate transaminase [Oscillospiraceae bacterium]|nr:histidinol-phosphate transaminase [Oscillospiraceae bacterium]
MSRYMSERFANLEAYVPGEQPQDMRYVKLNTNESPFPPSPAVLAALNRAEAEHLNLYPDPEGKILREKLAALYGVKTENIFLANGSDELLNFIFMTFCDQNRPVAYPAISYGFYPVYASLYGLPYTEVPLREGFRLEPGDYCGIHKTIVIANPNAPTGRTISVAEIEKILQSNPDNVVAVDEAYIDFGGESCVGLVPEYENLLVCQTFSKFRSMAGGRLGYAIGSKALIEDLDKIKYSTNSYNINRLTLAAAAAAIDSNDYYVENSKIIQENRAYTVAELEKLGFETLPSKANFIFTHCPKVPGGKIYQRLKAKGVLVRHWDKPEIAGYCRVTIGSREQMDVFLEKVREILREEGE